MMISTIDLRYPVGKFHRPSEVTPSDLAGWIVEIEKLPAELASSVAGLQDNQLDTPYRPDGWTVRQVVHHLADSHMNSLLRYRRALTEDTPTIHAYDQAIWADLPDARSGPIGPSMDLLSGTHQRWASLLRSMDAAQFRRSFLHPERGEMHLDWTTCMYAWHGRHHVAQILALRERQNW